MLRLLHISWSSHLIWKKPKPEIVNNNNNGKHFVLLLYKTHFQVVYMYRLTYPLIKPLREVLLSSLFSRRERFSAQRGSMAGPRRGGAGIQTESVAPECALPSPPALTVLGEDHGRLRRGRPHRQRKDTDFKSKGWHKKYIHVSF